MFVSVLRIASCGVYTENELKTDIWWWPDVLCDIESITY